MSLVISIFWGVILSVGEEKWKVGGPLIWGGLSLAGAAIFILLALTAFWFGESIKAQINTEKNTRQAAEHLLGLLNR